MPDLDTFRKETRAWLEENCPQSMRFPIESDEDACWGGRNFEFQSKDQRLWLERMAERGWTAPDWPAEYGGGGLSREQHKILLDEMARIQARPPLHSFGVWMIGPALLKFGSEALKQQHLPPIVRGEIRWCQGYSEPGAGSDLAGLQTKAEEQGDHFIVNGQKIWTSHADKSDWMFALVRTDPQAKKQEGISLVLLDMETPGVSTRPIRLISGSSPFCETFFDEVRVEKDQFVGEINKGWTIAKYLLTHERSMIGNMGSTAAGEKTLVDHAIESIGMAHGQLADPMLRGEVADWVIDSQAYELTAERMQDEAKAGQGVGNTSAMLKFAGTELNKRRHELMIALYGSDAMVLESEGRSPEGLAQQWLRSKGNSIEGGTSEVQLNIVARSILGLG